MVTHLSFQMHFKLYSFCIVPLRSDILNPSAKYDFDCIVTSVKKEILYVYGMGM